MTDWGPPLAALDFPDDVYQLSLAADRAMELDLSEGEDASRAELSAIRQAERRLGHRLHKGHALYNLGVVAFGRSPLAARDLFVAAYVEDVRTWVRRRPRGANAGPVLFNLYGAGRQLLARLAGSARTSAADPLELATSWASRIAVPESLVSIPTEGSRREDDLPVDERENFFIGGNYSECLDRIYDIREVVVENTPLNPVIVREYKSRDGESTRDKSFRLLDLCGLVVFDGSRAGGWDFEIEHLRRTRPEVPTLIVYSAASPDVPHPASMAPSTSEMPQLEKLPYGTSGDRRYAVLQWLLRRGVAPRHPFDATTWLHGSNTLLRPSRTSGEGALPGTATPERRNLTPSD